MSNKDGSTEGSKEGFFSRWARLKSDVADSAVPAAEAGQPAVVPASVPASSTPASSTPASTPVSGTTQQAGFAPGSEKPLPTLQDAAQLGADSDYSSFVGRGVDKDVRRLAMKKLFADPHFNVIDGLDIYMSDYNKPDPVSPSMLAALGHAQSFFAQVAIVEGREEQNAVLAAADDQTASAGASEAIASADPQHEPDRESHTEQPRQPDPATGLVQTTVGDTANPLATDPADQTDPAASSLAWPDPGGQRTTSQNSQ